MNSPVQGGEACVSMNCHAAKTSKTGVGGRTWAPAAVFGFPAAAAVSGSAPSLWYPEPRDDQAGSKDTRANAPSDQMGEFVSAVLGSTEAQWQKIFAQYGKAYEPPRLVMFSGVTNSACGFAQSAMGPCRAAAVHNSNRNAARL